MKFRVGDFSEIAEPRVISTPYRRFTERVSVEWAPLDSESPATFSGLGGGGPDIGLDVWVRPEQEGLKGERDLHSLLLFHNPDVQSSVRAPRRTSEEHTMKRHELLRVSYDNVDYFLNEHLLGAGEKRYNEDVQPGKFGQEPARQKRIERMASAAIFHHLELSVVPHLSKFLESGLSMAEDYFYGDWWKTPGNMDARRLDKSRADRRLEWVWAFKFGVFIAGLLQRWDRAEHLAEWIDDIVVADGYARASTEPGVVLYLLLADLLRRPNRCDRTKAEALIEQGADKGAKAYYGVIRSVIDNNAANWAKTFPKLVRYFLKEEAESAPFSSTVCVLGSILWMIAETKGFPWPKMDDKMSAVIVRQETVGS